MSEIIIHLIDMALPVLLGYVVWLLKEERKERRANTLGIQEILGYMIDNWHAEFIVQGYVTTDQRNTFENVYLAYSANHGNGARKVKWEEVQKLHIDDTKSNLSPVLQLLLDYKKSQEER